MSSLAHPIPEPPLLDERSLASAFASFTEAASSLERSYAHLQSEVARLRRELEETNCDLASSLEENRRIGQRLQRILEALPCTVLVVESAGLISLINPAGRELFGLEPQAMLPAALRDLLTASGSTACELEYASGGNHTKWLTVRCAELGLADPGSAVLIAQDVTEIRRLEREHAQLRKRQALAELSAVLAHEIRNPLGSLELFAALLAGSEISLEQKQWVAHLQAGLRTLGATVNNVLQFHGEPDLQRAAVDVGGLLRALVEFLGPLTDRARVRVELRHELNGGSVSADRHALQQVFLNLALNAIRAMPEGGTLTLTGTVRGQGADARVCLEVADTGCGIAPEQVEKIFAPGFTTRPGSAGLGLSVCRNIVERHSGTITVSSRPGAGSIFRIELPGAQP
jgi:signal transduction histidine kinase